jgi:hypothetical protein
MTTLRKKELSEQDFYDVIVKNVNLKLEYLNNHQNVVSQLNFFLRGSSKLEMSLENCLGPNVNPKFNGLQRIDPQKVLEYTDKLGVFYQNKLYVPVKELIPGKQNTYLLTIDRTPIVTTNCYEYRVSGNSTYRVRDCKSHCELTYRRKDGKQSAQLKGRWRSELLKAIKKDIRL